MGEGNTGEPQANHERLTVAQAAEVLGITEGAVRSRIKRGTLPTTKEGGTVFVRLAGGTSQANQTTNTSVPGDQSALIEALRDQIEDLRRERDEWREQARITDRLLSSAMERIPAIAAPSEERDEVEKKPPGVTDPGSAHLTIILGALSVVVVGSIPWLQNVLEVNLNLSPSVTNVALALFALPSIFGFYRGRWFIRTQEYKKQAPGEEPVDFIRWGIQEVMLALLTAAGAAFISFVETLGRNFLIQAVWSSRDVFAPIWVFLLTLSFYIFAVLIGAAIGGQRSGTDSSSTWWKSQLPQLIQLIGGLFGLLGTIITAFITIYAGG